MSKDFNPKDLGRLAVLEELSQSNDNFLQFVNSNLVEFVLNDYKTRLGSDIKPRVMNNWIKSGAVVVSESDKGKINRFNLSENVWLEIFKELRNYGLSLDKLKYAREQLNYNVKKFTYLKFNVIKSIFGNHSYMQIHDDGKIGFIPKSFYDKQVKRKARRISLNLDFSDYVKDVFEDLCDDERLDGLLDYENIKKLKLLFCLRTNFYEKLTVKLSDGDVRLVADTRELLLNEELLSRILSMDFLSIRIDIDKEVNFSID